VTTSKRLRGGTASRTRVLLANEDAQTATYLQGALRPPYIVDVAKDGLEVIEHALARRPTYAAVILEEKLPWLDGATLLRILRALRLMTPAVMLAERSVSHDEAAALGAAVVRRRGVTADDLRRAIASALSTPPQPPARPAPPWHISAFLEGDALDQQAAEFIGSGGEHIALVTSRPRAEHLCRKAGLPFGDVLFVDGEKAAQDILELRSTDSPAFDALVARLLDDIHKQFGNRRFRVHGDVVSMLVARRRPAWALALEYSWHRRFQQGHFSSMCGYRLADIRAGAGWIWIPDLCARHSFAVG
jgi:CheY-like chemotaxis protein